MRSTSMFLLRDREGNRKRWAYGLLLNVVGRAASGRHLLWLPRLLSDYSHWFCGSLILLFLSFFVVLCKSYVFK
jgi:hypothetical protein